MSLKLLKNKKKSEEIRCAIYLRVSSTQQADNQTSLPSQETECRKFAESKGWIVLDEHIYTDSAKSAKTANRPAFLEMIHNVRLGYKKRQIPFDKLLVWKFSRFARSTEDSILYKKLLSKRDVKVVSVSEPIDEGATGKLVEHILESMDEFYSANLAVETRRGMIENTKQGWRSGGTAPFGYRYIHVEVGKTKKGKLAVDPVEAEVVKETFSLASSGYGCNTISQKLNEAGYVTRKAKRWSKTGVNNMLRNMAYIGHTVWGKRVKHNDGYRIVPESEWIIAEDTHEAIVTKDVYDYVRKRMKARDPVNSHGQTTASRHPLTGMIYCGTCGGAAVRISGRSKRGKGFYAYYGCCRRHKDKGGCNGRTVRQEQIERAVFYQVEKEIFSDANLDIMVRDVMRTLDGMRTGAGKKIAKAENELGNLKEKTRKQILALEDDIVDIPAIKERLKELRKREDAKLQEIAKFQARHIEKNPNPVAMKSDLRQFKEAFKEIILGGTPEERKEILKEFVQKVIIQKRGVKIVYGVPDSKIVNFIKENGSGKKMSTRTVNDWLPLPDCLTK